MTEIRKSAVKVKQGKRVLFLTAFTVEDFLKRDDFYHVDRLDVQESTGMQRLLNQSRVNSYSKDIIDAARHDEVFLPTSVLLATKGGIGYDEDTQELFFDPSSDSKVCPFDVVDGQHRIEGFKRAAEKIEDDKQLLNFPIFTVIATKMKYPERMLHFVVVNTQQKPVDPGVTQHIIARFTDMHKVDPIPHLPGWLRKEIEKGEQSTALDIVKSLNIDRDSPWCERIQLADDSETRGRVQQKTFVRSVSKYLLARNHPLLQICGDDSDKRLAILKNFWKAIENIFVSADTDKQTVVFKAIGLEFFHALSAPMMRILARDEQYTVDAFERCIRLAGDYLDERDAKIMLTDYWESGGEASGLNVSAAQRKAATFSDALIQAHSENRKIRV